MPAEVSLDSLEEGAILADDVLDSRQNVLLRSGTTVTRAHVSLIRRRGIDSVTVRTPEDAVAEEAASDPARIADAVRRQEIVFSKTHDNELMSAIYRAARVHIEAGNLPPG